MVTILIILLVTLAPNAAAKSNRLGKMQLVPFHQKSTLTCLVVSCDKSPAKVRSVIIDTVGNIGLFLPLGFLTALALARKKFQTRSQLWQALLVGMFLSASIETAQFWLPTRVTSLDDVILNSSGALLGALLLQIFAFTARRRPAWPASQLAFASVASKS